MKSNELNEIKSLIEEVASSLNKTQAKAPLTKLRVRIGSLRGKIDPYLLGKLTEAMNYSSEAAGRSGSKQHWLSQANESWLVFENGIEQVLEEQNNN
ncbi:hypothetical protein [Halioxenophilus aromaticivorans]|uniref:Uncharacterized protein n=1 Tax=Halioxenophilus aromaticivorans TaxID=1306992 RepID=A0AAV3U082_9ALTE